MKPKHIFTTLLILTVLALLLWQKSNTANKQAIINQTGQEAIPKENPQPQVKTEAKQPQKVEQDIIDWHITTDSDQAKERSYMMVYDDLKFAKRCESYYRDEQEKTGLFNIEDFFKHQITDPLNQTPPPTATQLTELSLFLQACDALKKATFIRANISKRYPTYHNTYPVITELTTELENTQAVSDAEQSLQKTLALKKQWHELLNALLEESIGPQIMTEEELQATTAEMMELTSELTSQNENGERPDTETIQRVMTRLNELQAAMSATAAVDENARNQLLTEFIQLEPQLRQQLQSPHLETFITAMSALEFNDGFDLRVNPRFDKFNFQAVMKYIPEYISPSQVLHEISGITDTDYYDVLIKPASRMFLCHKGYDCSETSELVTEHCFGSMDELNFVAEEIHPQACGLDVNTFYNDHFLTVNQAEDVQALFNVMVNHYAQ